MRRLSTSPTAPSGSCPILDRLESFSPTRALVFGSRGDTSRDVDLVLQACAQSRARREWRALGARSQGEAYGVILGGLRRFVGVSIAREFARHRLRRLPLVGVPRALLDARRQALRGGRMVVMEGRAERPFATQDFYAAQAHAAIGLRAS